MAAVIVQSGFKALTANSATNTATFGATAIAGNKLIVIVNSDDAVSSVKNTGGTAANFTSRKAAAAFQDIALYDQTALGTETGITIVIGSITGQVAWWFEVSGLGAVDVTGSSTANATSGNQPVGSVTPSSPPGFVLWGAGDDSSIVYDSTSTGTFDGSVASTQTTGTKVSLGVGHNLSASGATAPTVHNSLGPANCSGVIVAYLIAGGTNYTPSQADAEGVADAASAAQDNARTQADALGVTDAASPVQAAARTTTDPVGLTDAATTVAANARTQADAVGLTDSATTTLGPIRTQADAVGLTDLLAAAQVLLRSIADPAGLVDAATPVQAQFVSQSDAAGITDSASAVITNPTSNYQGFLDSDSSLLTFGADATNSINVGTVAGATTSGQVAIGARFWVASGATVAGQHLDVGLFATVADIGSGIALATGTLSSLTANAWNEVDFTTPFAMTSGVDYVFVIFAPASFYSFANDYFFLAGGGPIAPDTGATGMYLRGSDASFGAHNGLFDYGIVLAAPTSVPARNTWYGVNPVMAAGTSNYTPSQSDPVGITDALAATQAQFVTSSDPVGLTDSLVRGLDAVRVVSDPIGLVDSTTSSQAVARTVSDPENITDAATPTQANVRVVPDPVGITDSASGVISAINYTANVNDSIGITDTGTQQVIDYNEVLDPDPIGITDAETVVQATNRTVADPVGITDSATPVLVTGGTNYTPSVADPVGLTDNATATQVIARTQSDPIGITDSASAVLIPAGSSVVTDPEGITDQLTPVQAQFVSPSDPIGVTDVLTASSAFLRALADSVGLTDSVAASLGLLRTLSDAVGLADLLTASLVHTPVNYTVAINDPIGITDSAGSVNPARDLDLDIMAAAQRWLVTIDALCWEVR